MFYICGKVVRNVLGPYYCSFMGTPWNRANAGGAGDLAGTLSGECQEDKKRFERGAPSPHHKPNKAQWEENNDTFLITILIMAVWMCGGIDISALGLV